MNKLNIAVVGSGVAGLTAAYILNREHNITIFEKNDYVGGHTHTVTVNHGDDRDVPVDTGFIVMNYRTYPNLTKLFEQLGTRLRESDMSFGYKCELSSIEYSSRGVTAFFNRIKNVFNRSYYRIFRDIVKFHRKGKADLREGKLSGLTLGQYLKENGFSDDFIHHHIIPMGSAVWSTPSETMLDFPAESFIRFLNNHGLMSLAEAPQWLTVVGGSHDYVKRILATLKGDVFVNKGVKAVKRNDSSVTITTADGEEREFDKVIIATHADEAFKLLADPSDEEKRLLSPWNYNYNYTILHTDVSAMPENRRVWSSWNFIREAEGEDGESLCLTYDMNRLQGLETEHNYFVTLNTKKKLDREKIILEIEYYHPQFTLESMATQKELPSLNGVRNTYFCGSYFNYGFHEDAATSGLEVARMFGLDL